MPGDLLNLGNLEQALQDVSRQLGSMVNDLLNKNYTVNLQAPVSTAFSASQASVDTNPTLLAAANTSRKGIKILNLSGGQAIYLGGSGVAAGTGYLLPVGETFEMKANEGLSTAAIYAITASSSTTVYVLEW